MLAFTPCDPSRTLCTFPRVVRSNQIRSTPPQHITCIVPKLHAIHFHHQEVTVRSPHHRSSSINSYALGNIDSTQSGPYSPILSDHIFSQIIAKTTLYLNMPTPNSLDHIAIQNTLARYCIALDDKDFAALSDVFVADCDTHYPFPGGDLKGVAAVQNAIQAR